MQWEGVFDESWALVSIARMHFCDHHSKAFS
jgi:hypothetical protein